MKHFYKKCKVPTNPLKVVTATLVGEWHHMSSPPVHHPCGYTGLDLNNRIFTCDGNTGHNTEGNTFIPFGTKKCPHLLAALRNLPLSAHESAT